MAAGDASIPWLPAGIRVDDLVAFGAGFATLLVIVAIYQTLRVDRSFERRLRGLSERRLELRAAGLRALGRRKRSGPTAKGLINDIVNRLNLIRRGGVQSVQLTLARAGLRSRDAIAIFLFFRLCMPVVMCAAAVLDCFLVPVVGMPAWLKLPVILLSPVLGFYSPSIYLRNRATKRREQMKKALPDGLDLLVICVEAGLTLDAAVARVAKEMGPAATVLADEFGLAAVELTFLPERRQALENLGERVNLPALGGVINTLLQAEKFGTPLAQALRVLSAEFRQTRMMEAEEKAARLPALLTVPMMLFILPVLFVVLVGPAGLQVYDMMTRH